MSTTPISEISTLDILMVLWREMDDLHKLAQDLKNQTFQNFTVHVALNDPTPEISKSLKEAYPHWYFYEGPNTGYAGGLQRIWPKAHSSWILIANTDLRWEIDFLEKFVGEANSIEDPQVGILAPKVLYPDGRLQSVAGLRLGPEGLARPRGIDEEDQGQYDHIEEAPLPSGCCFMIKKDVLRDIDGFDAKFFMYVEDVDMALRALWAGWKSKAINNLSVIHHHGGAAGRRSALQLYHLERNHWWVMPLLPLSMRLKMPFVMVRRWLILKSRTRDLKLDNSGESLVKVAISATISGLLGLPRVFLRRTPKRITKDEFCKRLEGHTISLEEFLKS